MALPLGTLFHMADYKVLKELKVFRAFKVHRESKE
jgi:hypothetical protein